MAQCAAMHIRLRPLLSFALYILIAVVSGYFVWHGLNGQRGLKTSREYEQRIEELRGELAGLKAERGRWERKISLIRGESVDRDILDNEARASLGRAHKNEVVILLPRPEPRNAEADSGKR
jgi:cell division protein FtsB